ncbi:MAG: hypothetical protein MJ238_03475 [Bacilli bacterium]|nr:hypothetical protein [Bacilli bacterium]
MNQNCLVLATLVRYQSMIRDTLEYTLPRDNYDVNVYNTKKAAIIAELENNTPLKSFISNNGENGEKFEKQIREFHDTVYGDGSTILKLANDGLRVDHAQHIAIFKGVIPVHETVSGLINGYIADAKSKNLDVAAGEAAALAEEKFYRGVCFLTLSQNLVKLFNDYNEARREAKGAETAASRFIGNDISDVIRLVREIEDNSRLTDERFWGAADKLRLLVHYMTGRRALPMGVGMGEMIRQCQDAVAGYVREVETDFHAVVDPFMNEFVADVRAQAEAANAAPADAAN